MDKYYDPEKLTESMKSGLARMYADDDIRGYLLHVMSVYNHNTLVFVRAGKSEEARDSTAKFDTIKKLIENGKAMYTQAEKLKPKPIEQAMKDNEKKT